VKKKGLISKEGKRKEDAGKKCDRMTALERIKSLGRREGGGEEGTCQKIKRVWRMCRWIFLPLKKKEPYGWSFQD